MEQPNIGKQLLDFSKEEGLTVRGALDDLFPYIYAVSERLSTRKISQWLEDQHQIKISFSSIAKALQKADIYIEASAAEYYGEAKALDFYIPPQAGYDGLAVLGSRSLLNALKIEEPLYDPTGVAVGIVKSLEKTWFELPEKYRKACLAVMRERQKQERKKNETTESE